MIKVFIMGFSVPDTTIKDFILVDSSTDMGYIMGELVIVSTISYIFIATKYIAIIIVCIIIINIIVVTSIVIKAEEFFVIIIEYFINLEMGVIDVLVAKITMMAITI